MKKIFLSYARLDEPKVSQIHSVLKNAGCSVWWYQDIKPGQKGKFEISKAMEDADCVVLCLSHNYNNRSGFIQKEINAVAENLKEYLPSDIYIIPIKLDNCETPFHLKYRIGDLQHLNLAECFKENKLTEEACNMLIAAVNE